MADQVASPAMERHQTKVINRTSAAVPIYGFGVFGAAVYYIQHAATFWIALLGILKAMVWPAMVVYKVLEMLKM